MKMKRMVIILSLLITVPLFSEDKAQFLFDSSLTHGGYGALVNKITFADNKTNWMMGIKGGWIINHLITMNVVVNWLMMTDSQINSIPLNGSGEFMIIYPGIEPGLVLFSNNLIHAECWVLVGEAISATIRHASYGENLNNISGQYAVEPGLDCSFNLYEFLRLNIGISYILAHDKASISGWAGNIILKFGSF
jgi:hypothetical protein